jgi:hypothetical protein
MPTIGVKKKYLEMASMDSIPMGRIVKKPNNPFNPLMINSLTPSLNTVLCAKPIQ